MNTRCRYDNCTYNNYLICDLCNLTYCKYHSRIDKWDLYLCRTCERNRHKIYYGQPFSLDEYSKHNNYILSLYKGYTNNNYIKHDESFYKWTKTFQLYICKHIPIIAKCIIRNKILMIIEELYLPQDLNMIILEYYIE